jgi:hypothetical protein
MPTAVEKFRPIFSDAGVRYDESLNLGQNIKLLLPAVNELLPAVQFGGLVSGQVEFPGTEPTGLASAETSAFAPNDLFV